ncbi:polysaccharide pyruvyl transferase family protein [Pseudomonas schmalbachii]|uniref:Polysaccharide pyruvyl transferase family protein n=1 Tax=Pseudomonas schmalbachii TaxID=2816993 RepID=A0ABS3TX66_9PSED|nr:polysaccharide pyruvyl transferase family protein [Pseudomonas schmalbachii]MBO3277154.1 polysaccharide pyruvyl transferase family protein [Pseudomonas schmalbachii]
MNKVLILHAYSAENAGDGLLVSQAINLAKEALGEQIEITICASHPKSFAQLSNIKILDSMPKWYGYNTRYLRTLFSARKFDVIIGVGGGYLRAGNYNEALKTLLVHGPQLICAAFNGRKSIYLPQSIGPIHRILKPTFYLLLSKLRNVFLRDNRSMSDFPVPTASRMADLAILEVFKNTECKLELASLEPIFSVRFLNGIIPIGVLDLISRFEIYDAYIQSTVRSNDDRPATSLLRPQHIIPRENFIDRNNKPRVVIAMRLHAALMALAAGHFVIHLSYERKGFGAFGDLGLPQYVHNVNNFCIDTIYSQIHSLTEDIDVRSAYKKCIASAKSKTLLEHDSILKHIRKLATN